MREQQTRLLILARKRWGDTRDASKKVRPMFEGIKRLYFMYDEYAGERNKADGRLSAGYTR